MPSGTRYICFIAAGSGAAWLCGADALEDPMQRRRGILFSCRRRVDSRLHVSTADPLSVFLPTPAGPDPRPSLGPS